MPSASLLDRAGSVNKRLRVLATMNSLADKADSVRTRATVLKTAADELDPLVSVIRAFRAHEIPTDAITAAPLSLIRRQLISLGKAYAENPDQIAAPDGSLRALLWSPLSSLTAQLHQMLLISWQAHCEALTPHQQSGVLEVLARIPGLQDDAVRINLLREELEERSGSLPRDEADLARVSELAARIDLEWRTLEGAGIPAEVLNFLRKASRGGANLAELSAGVRIWLEERDLGHFIRIIMTDQ
jgi:hypothetical protein